MIKDVFVLSKKAYHCKMMKYIWNLNYFDFSHMCPYFWLTIFNHFIFPVVFLIKESIKGVAKFAEFLADWAATLENKKIQNYIDKIAHNDENFIEELTNNSYLRKKLKSVISDYNHYDYKVRNILYDALSKTGNVLYEKKRAEELEKDKKRYEKIKKEEKEAEEKRRKDVAFYNSEMYRIQKEREEKQRIARKKLIVKLNSIIKPVLTVCAYILGAIVVTSVLYGFYRLFHYFAYDISAVSSKALKHNLFVSLMIVIVIASAVFIGFLIYKLTSTITIRISLPSVNIKIPKSISRFFIKCGNLFIYIGNKFAYVFIQIGKGFSLTVQMFKIQCPAIKWKD